MIIHNNTVCKDLQNPQLFHFPTQLEESFENDALYLTLISEVDVICQV